MTMRIIFLLAGLLVSWGSLAYTISDGVAKDVATWSEVVALAANDEVGTISVSRAITIPDGTAIDFGDKLVTVPSPYLDAAGAIKANGVSPFNVFTVGVGSTVCISNVYLNGGFAGIGNAGGIVNHGFLSLWGVSISRSATALFNDVGATAILNVCAIVRCANDYGGGILNKGSIVMDKCSLIENRSLGASGGGGACENQGKMYVNNTTFAQNSSAEIGGAINNCGNDTEANLYLINSTVVGNVTTASDARYGGAIGNNKGRVFAGNSIFADNKQISGGQVAEADIGVYESATAAGASVSMVGCICGAVSGDASFVVTNGCTTDTRGLFASYRDDGVLSLESGVTAGFSHPVVISADGRGDSLYSPLSAGSAACAGEYVTYFDYSMLYTNASAAVVMSYRKSDDQTTDTPLGIGVVTAFDGLNPVDTAYDGSDRSTSPTIGASGLPDDSRPIFTVWVGSSSNGRIGGPTISGASYRTGDIATLAASPDSGFCVAGWKTAKSEDGLAEASILEETAGIATYAFAVTGDVWVVPVFRKLGTEILAARQRYPWNNLVDIDYCIKDDMTEYRLVFFAEYEENGVRKAIQLKSFRDNADVSKLVRLNDDRTNLEVGRHRVTWDAQADGVAVFNKNCVTYVMRACQGVER